MRRLLLILCLLTFLTHSVLASSPILNNSNDLLSASIPISYGETLFKERIAKSTKGEREAVGLVLSGGSARAFAHIGVLKYLEEQNIVPDYIISNSMGSIVAILYAAGLSSDQILYAIEELDITQLFDLTVPLKGGVLDISRFLSLFDAFIGANSKLEELLIPIMIVSEDLTTKRQVLMMEGDVATVLGAAFALPVYFTPVLYKGHLLIDGGITNLVPLEIAYRYGNTNIVSTTFYEGEGINLRNPLSILNVSIDIGKRRAGVEQLLQYPSAIWIRCDVEGFSFMDFGSVAEITQKGYQSASLQKERLETIPSSKLSEELLAKREYYEERKKEFFTSYNLFQRTKIVSFSQQLFFGLQSFNYLPSLRLLRDETVLGVAYKIRWDRLFFSLNGGFGSELHTPFSLYGEITSHLSYQPFSSLLIEGDISVSGEEGVLHPTLYHRVGFQLRHTFLENRLLVKEVGWWERESTFNFKPTKQLFNIGVDFTLKKETIYEQIYGSLAYQISERWNRQFLHLKVDSTFRIPSELFIQAGLASRIALDKQNSVPLYWKDGFRSGKSSLFSENRVNGFGALFVSNLKFYWKPQTFKPTAAETLIFENSSIGLFGDLLWDEMNWRVKFIVGGELSTTISFVGLSSMPTTLFMGYDSTSEAVVWGIGFGRSY